MLHRATFSMPKLIAVIALTSVMTAIPRGQANAVALKCVDGVKNTDVLKDLRVCISVLGRTISARGFVKSGSPTDVSHAAMKIAIYNVITMKLVVSNDKGNSVSASNVVPGNYAPRFSRKDGSAILGGPKVTVH